MCWITQKILFFIICLLPKKQEYLDKHLSNIIANRKPNIKKHYVMLLVQQAFISLH